MFDKLRKAFSRDGKPPAAATPAVEAAAMGPMSEWAATQGFAFTASGAAFQLQGDIGGRPWKMEVGRPSRKYIQGEELRARAELGVDPDVAVVLMNRPLKNVLEKQAYSHYTDSLRTSVDSSLPEELRWLAMYQEVGWESAPRVFWDRYSILADTREHALAWFDSALVRQLLEWPAPAPEPTVPFMMMLLRGKAYLRMQQGAAQVPVLQHASQVFHSACESALGAFKA